MIGSQLSAGLMEAPVALNSAHHYIGEDPPPIEHRYLSGPVHSCLVLRVFIIAVGIAVIFSSASTVNMPLIQMEIFLRTFFREQRYINRLVAHR